jgi:hypothetical protein
VTSSADDLPEGLSDRALRFVRELTWRTAMADGVIEPCWPVGWDGDRSAMLSAARRFARRYGGLFVEVEGGPLEGSILLGGGTRPTVRLSREGTPMLDAAHHDTAQCQIVLSEAGQVGCSWTDEFHLLFDSVENFVEDCALWREHHGWWYAATLSDDPARIHALLGRCAVEELQLGSGVEWLFGSDVAVASHPFLTDIAPRRTVVLARDERGAVELWRLLRANGVDVPVDPRRFRWRVGD